jgi:hypothetical protein
MECNSFLADVSNESPFMMKRLLDVKKNIRRLSFSKSILPVNLMH